ncbi:MAG: GAF domain-containing protein [Chloroflexi bacterium]|nr:GAF domain-containing protein [Chloroflexota bacterium]
MTQVRDGTEQGRQFARWLADQADAGLDASMLDAGRLLLQLRANRAFLRHIESTGTTVAERGGSLSGLLATALERMGALGTAVLRNAPPSQHEAVVDELVQLQTATVQALVRGYDAIVPINATPTERERLLDNTVRALDRINSVINSSLELNEVLLATVESVSDHLGVSEVTIYLYDEAIGRLILSATRAFNPEAVGQTTLALGEGIIGWAAQVGQPVAVRDAWSDPRFKYVPGLGEEDLRSFLVVPIVLFTFERLIGVLSMASPEFRDFTDEEVRFAEITAGQLAIAVENARLHGQTDDALHGKIEQLTTVQNLARTLTTDLEPESVLAQIAQSAAHLIDVDKAAIWQVDADGKRMRIVASYNLGDAYRRHSLGIGDGVVGRAVATRAPVVVNDAMNDERLVATRELIATEGYGALFSVPLILRDRAVGAISLYSPAPHEYTQEQVDLAFTFANHAAIAIENARLFEEVRQGLETKSILLQEMHHRVKNNMQTIASLLEMQARRTETQEASTLLKLSAGRIGGMARVHDLLSQDAIGQTTVHQIIDSMADMLRGDLNASGRRIEITVEARPGRIQSEKATVFALVINELLWNAVEHGMAGRTTGRIHVDASAHNGRLAISIEDDGIGLPEGFSLMRDQGLGLTIVRNLVERNLDGDFDIAPRQDAPGAVATMRFRP